MLLCSPVYKAAIAVSHSIAVTVTVQDPQNHGIPTPVPILIDQGGVTVDRTATIRRTCSITIADNTGLLNPVLESAPLAPFGNELVISRGVILPDGTAEMKQLGIFGFQVVDTPDATGTLGTILIAGFDRSKRVSLAQLVDGYVISAGTNVGSAIHDLIEQGVPGLSYQFATTTKTTPLQAFSQKDDRWVRAVEIAQSIGMELFFDAFGVCVMRPEPDPDAQPVSWTYQDVNGGMLLDSNRQWTTDATYSVVVATASGSGITGTIPTATALDNNPLSATYYLGKFGRRTFFYSSPLLLDVPQCQDAALAQLRRVTGSYQQIGFSAIVNPAHEAGDIITVVDSETGIESRYLLDSVTIPLVPETPMTANTRKRNV